VAFDLPRLPVFSPQDWGELAAFMSDLQVWWQQVVEAIETQETTQDDLLAQIIAAQDAAAAASAAAATAQTTANTANTTATAVKKTDKISAAWTSPGAVLSATDAGSNATVSVAAHTRKWGDGTSTSVNSHNFTGKAYSTDYYVYYDDPNQNDTTPSYQITTNPNTAAPNAASNRVYVGAVTTPAAGAADTSGGTLPPGGGYSGPGAIP
jgi:cell pole-organizing protein PopZ